MNIKESLILAILIIIFMSGSVFSQMGRRANRGSRGRNVGRIEKDPNSIEEKEQTLEQRVSSLENEIERLQSRINLLELDNNVLFFELISFRAEVYRENIIDDIRKTRDTRTQEERWEDAGIYPMIVGDK